MQQIVYFIVILPFLGFNLDGIAQRQPEPSTSWKKLPYFKNKHQGYVSLNLGWRRSTGDSEF